MPEPFTPPLTSDQVRILDSAVATWADQHPSPDYAAFAFAGSTPFSPRELAEALHRRDGELVDQFLLMTRFAMEVESLEAIVERFYRGRSIPS